MQAALTKIEHPFGLLYPFLFYGLPFAFYVLSLGFKVVLFIHVNIINSLVNKQRGINTLISVLCSHKILGNSFGL
jgi:hypothetical protein